MPRPVLNNVQQTLYSLVISLSIFLVLRVHHHLLPQCSTWCLSTSCFRRMPPGPRAPSDQTDAWQRQQQLPDPTPHSHWPTWAWMSPLWSSLDSASSALECNSHSPPLESSKKLRGWAEASHRPVGIQPHLYHYDRGFSLYTDGKTLNKCWP